MSTKNVWVINAGSSSIKYEFFDMAVGRSLATGLLEQIGTPQAHLQQKVQAASDASQINRQVPAPDHRTGLKVILTVLAESGLAQGVQDLYGIGHRVVHGGPDFSGPVRIDNTVIAKLERFVPLAPLHQPNNLLPIKEIHSRLPDLPQVACFDTAFHRDHPPLSDRYALPQDLYELGVRRYGFHGLSYEFIANLIRENKTFRINSSIQTGHKLGMQLLDDHLFKLWRDGIVEEKEALVKANMPEDLAAKIAQAKRGMLESEDDMN